MAFPTGITIPTTNLDSPSSDPSQARVDLLQLVETVNQIIASINLASGPVLLNGSGFIDSSVLPSSYTQSGNISLVPGTKIVNIRDVLRLTQRYTVDNALLDTAQAGDIIYLVDGDAGQPCLAVNDGSQWRVVRLMTQVGDVGAALTAVSTLEATAD